MPPLDAAAVKSAARAAGFHEVGIARARPLDPGPLARVLANGWEADMAWLGTQARERLDVARLLPGARSVVALALSYAAPDAVAPTALAAAPPADGEGAPDPEAGAGAEGGAAGAPQRPELPEAPPGVPGGLVARYARGRDYHAVMRRRLKDLTARLRALDPGLRAFASSDIAPVMEKAWAQEAGVGWVGKNACLLTPRHGSWVLLATVILDRELAPDAPHPDRCGDCAACLPACPTGAFPAPGFVDSRRCLSFQTIERRGPVPGAVAERLGAWVFGCDDCQAVCPWNRAVAPSADPELLPRRRALDLGALLALDERGYQATCWGTSLARARYEGLVRNAVLAAGHSGDARFAEGVRAHLESPFPGVREAARWALPRLAPEPPRR